MVMVASERKYLYSENLSAYVYLVTFAAHICPAPGCGQCVRREHVAGAHAGIRINTWLMCCKDSCH
eukprot:439185-Amphidinium_carterae.1